MSEIGINMIIALIGDNSYKIKLEKNKIVQSFVNEHGELAVEYFNDESSPTNIYDALNNLPFLVEKKLVVIENPSTLKDLPSSLMEWLEYPSNNVDVLIIDPKPDKRTAWYKYIIQNMEVIICVSMDEQGLRLWINEYVKNNQSTIEKRAAEELVKRVGFDQNQIKNELNKLMSYDDNISVESVSLLVDALPKDTIFDLLDALISGNSKKTMDLYENLVITGIDPHEILAMIGWQLHTLLLVKTSSMAPETNSGLHPYVVRKNSALASRLSLIDLKKLIDYAVNAELQIKRDGLNSNNVVSVLLHKILLGL